MAHRIKEICNNFTIRIQTLRFLVLRTGVRFTPVRSFRANTFVLANLWISTISSFFKNLRAPTITFFILFWLSISLAMAADTLPPITPMGLPFESAGEATRPIVIIIRETIKYVGLFAILAVSWGWIQFLTSMGNDEKVKHAKQTVIYALVWVLLSVVAYTIIDIVNSLKIN